MKKNVIGLTFVLLSLFIFGCKVDVNSSDTDPIKTENENQNEIENQKLVVNGGVLQGKALYSNSNDSSSIQVILDKTDGLFTEQLLDLTNQNANQGRSVLSAARTVVSYQNCAKDGSYEFSNLEEGTYTVYAASPDSTEKAVYKSIVVGKDQTVQVPQMTLTATGALSGKITLDGSTDNNAGFVIFAGGTSFMAVTALDGSFTLSGLPANTSYQIIVMRGAYTHLWKNDEQAEPLGNTYIGELNLTSDTIKLTGKDGKNGTNGTDGKDGKDGISIIWKGSFPDASALSTPQYLWAYFNTTDGCSYIYDGENWTLLASAGENKTENTTARVLISYELDGGILPPEAPLVYVYGKNTRLIEPTKTGYHFEGFYFNSDYSGEQITTLGNDYIIGQTLYAKWKQCRSIYYYARINGYYTAVKTEYYTDQEFETAVLSGYERSGYDFNGWNKNQNWVSDTYQAGTSLKTIFANDQQSLTLYAISSPIEYTITYNCGSATNAPSNPTTYTIEQDITINDGTLNGDTFGWTINETSATCNGWIAGEQTGDITLVIDIRYRITYNLRNGTNDERNPDKYAPGQAVTLYQPTKQNYIFDGWFTNSDYSGSPLTGWAAGDKNQHITLYARWTNAVVNRILNLSQSETIILTGEYNADDFAEIRLAMAELYRKNDSINISLDLSNIQIADSDLSFTGVQNLKTIVLPSCINTIPDHAFDGCGLESVTIPSNVKILGNYAFANNDHLVNVTIEEGLNKLYGYAFYGCMNLEEITLPSSINSINETAFNNCKSLERIIILSNTFTPNSSPSWFSRCPSLREFYCLGLETNTYLPGDSIWSNILLSNRPPVITNDGWRFAYLYQTDRWALGGYQGPQTNLVLPSSFQVSTTTITDYDIFLKNDTTITNVTIPGDIATISDYAFYNCSNLLNVTISQGVKTIKPSAFKGCSKLTTISIPSSVTRIGDSAFLNCERLTSITIPTSVTSIGDYAFAYCFGLTSIIIPNTVTSVGSSAFSNCYNLTTVTIPEYCITNDYSFYYYHHYDRTMFNKIFTYCENLSTVIIQDGCTKIPENAFFSCSSLTNITIPDSVTEIEEYAFYECNNLTSITIPASVNVIGDSAFEYSGLQKVIVLGSQSSLGYHSFWTSSLKEFYWVCPDYEDYLSYLYTHVIVDDSISFLFSDMLPVQTEDGYFLLTHTKGNYSENAEWFIINYLGTETDLVLPDSFTIQEQTISNYEIASSAFSNNRQITTIIIPEGVKHLYEYTFLNCTKLEALILPSSLEFIGREAFSNCSNLRWVEFGITSGWYINSEVPIRCSSEMINATNLKSTYLHDEWRHM